MGEEESDFHFYRPQDGHRLARDPLKAIIAPRPIGWISTQSGDGIANLAPYSFFAMICDTPPLIAFSSMGRKDSLANVEETGEFVCNLATRDLAEALNASAAAYPADVDEFERAGLDKATSLTVKAPRVALASAALECRLVAIQQLTDMDGMQIEGGLVIGQVTGVHIARRLIHAGRFDTGSVRIIQRAGYGGDYAEIDQAALFQMPRPPQP